MKRAAARLPAPKKAAVDGVAGRRAIREARRLAHELEVHREELQSQNTELLRVQAELAASLARYAELYEGAPVGYLTLDEGGNILEGNRAASALLGMPQSALPSMTLVRFVARGSIPTLQAALDGVQGSQSMRHAELQLLPADSAATLNVSLELDADPASKTIRAMLFDVTEQRTLERAVQSSARAVQERISSEIHDGLGQELTGLSLMLRALFDQVSHSEVVRPADVARLSAIVDHTISSCRDIVRGLSPTAEFQGGLRQALSSLAETAQVPGGPHVTFSARVDAPLRIDAATNDHLYRIAQECVNNACKHSRARELRISLAVDADVIRLQVEDDGVGFGPAARESAGGGLGLFIMRYRATTIHAQLTFERTSGGGIRMSCLCPQPERAA